KVDDVLLAVIDAADLNPVGTRRRCPFHEEEVAAGAVRVPLHHHRAIADVRQQHRRDVGVVLQQVAFRQLQLGPEDLAKVAETDLLAGDEKCRVVLAARNRYPRAHLIGGSFGGRAPCSVAPMTGTYGSSSPSRALRSSKPPRLMSPRPTKSIGNSSRSPKILVSRTTSQSSPISRSSARALFSSGRR